tara:strand:- start:190 stop:453 length:264 start_codon:yes stop_codon:yes gene_type:complete
MGLLDQYIVELKVGYQGERMRMVVLDGEGKGEDEGYSLSHSKPGTGMYHGRGQFIYADGSVYDGDWQHNKFHGNGTYTYVIVRPDQT